MTSLFEDTLEPDTSMLPLSLSVDEAVMIVSPPLERLEAVFVVVLVVDLDSLLLSPYVILTPTAPESLALLLGAV